MGGSGLLNPWLDICVGSELLLYAICACSNKRKEGREMADRGATVSALHPHPFNLVGQGGQISCFSSGHHGRGQARAAVGSPENKRIRASFWRQELGRGLTEGLSWSDSPK